MFLPVLLEIGCVYGLTGYLLTQVIKRWTILSWELVTLFSYGCGPLLVSLFAFLLYFLFPNQPHQFYYSIVFGLILSGFATLIAFHQKSWKKLAGRWPTFFNPNIFLTFFKKLAKLPKSELLIILYCSALVIFVLICLIFYPTTWGDLIAYIEQGYVYHFGHSHQMISSLGNFYRDGLFYPISSTVRPAIPVLYSLTYEYNLHRESEQLFFRFFYLYYFGLTLGIYLYFGRLLKISRSSTIFGLALLLSCFYFLRFTIFGFKEIAIIFFALLSLILIYQLLKEIGNRWLLAAALGICLGLNMYINYSSIIIGGILGLIFSIFLLSTKTQWRTKLGLLFLTAIVALLFSAAELWHASTSFILNRSMYQPIERPLESGELDAYHLSPAVTTEKESALILFLTPTQLNLLLKGKLQAFTQIQNYGFIFYIFLLVFLFCWRRAKTSFNYFDRLLLGFIGSYFLIFADPFFLNQHVYSYILAISPKYTIILASFAVLFVMKHFHELDNFWSKLTLPIVLACASSTLLLVPFIRQKLANIAARILLPAIPLYQTETYYLATLQQFFFLLGLCGILLSCVYLFRKSKKTIAFIQLNRGVVFGLILFIPNLILLNNNFLIWPTLVNIAQSRSQKLIRTAATIEDQNFFSLIDYLNVNVENDAPILSLVEDNRLYLYLNNTRRLLPPLTSRFDRTHYVTPVYVISYTLLQERFPQFKNHTQTYQNQTFTLLKK